MVRRMGIPKREYHGTGSGGVRRFRRYWWTDAHGRTKHGHDLEVDSGTRSIHTIHLDKTPLRIQSP